MREAPSPSPRTTTCSSQTFSASVLGRVVAVVMCRTFLLTHLSVVARRGAPVLTDHCGARRGCSRPRGAIFHIVRCRLTCRTWRRPARSHATHTDTPGPSEQ
ncbi:hypothetical protein MICRO11B_50016 [Micrococcus luteus]|nr:hypothetical protein MICRO11B_50016 [Micrococcus luteus]